MKPRMCPRPKRRALAPRPPRSATVQRLERLLTTDPPTDAAGARMLRCWLLRCRAADFGILEVTL